MKHALDIATLILKLFVMIAVMEAMWFLGWSIFLNEWANETPASLSLVANFTRIGMEVSIALQLIRGYPPFIVYLMMQAVGIGAIIAGLYGFTEAAFNSRTWWALTISVVMALTMIVRAFRDRCRT